MLFVLVLALCRGILLERAHGTVAWTDTDYGQAQWQTGIWIGLLGDYNDPSPQPTGSQDILDDTTALYYKLIDTSYGKQLLFKLLLEGDPTSSSGGMWSVVFKDGSGAYFALTIEGWSGNSPQAVNLRQWGPNETFDENTPRNTDWPDEKVAYAETPSSWATADNTQPYMIQVGIPLSVFLQFVTPASDNAIYVSALTWGGQGNPQVADSLNPSGSDSLAWTTIVVPEPANWYLLTSAFLLCVALWRRGRLWLGGVSYKQDESSQRRA